MHYTCIRSYKKRNFTKGGYDMSGTIRTWFEVNSSLAFGSFRLSLNSAVLNGVTDGGK